MADPKDISLKKTKKILFVEDDDNLAKVYSDRFKDEGFDVKRVADGEKAMAAAVEYKPDLVLLDIMLPNINGFDVLDILRNTPGIGSAKFIILTARGQETDKKRAEALGADDYLVKSQVMIADVVERIKRQLGLE